VIQSEDIVTSGRKLYEFLSVEVDKRRTSLTDDIIGTLVKAKFDDARQLTHEEIVNMALLLVLGGLETTVSATTGAVFYLVQHPEEQGRLLQADERLWRLALDEFVRWVSPLQGIGRTVRHDTDFKGCPMHAGDRVLMLWGSGNRDETAFRDPEKVILDRFPNHHLGFGMGPHRCIGSHLAKAMMQISLQGFLKGLSNFRLEDPNGIVCTAAEARSWKRMRLVRK
jgi:cytochrome P450